MIIELPFQPFGSNFLRSPGLSRLKKIYFKNIAAELYSSVIPTLSDCHKAQLVINFLEHVTNLPAEKQFFYVK